MLSLCLLPVIFAVFAIIKPHAGAPSSSALWGVTSVLSILVTNFLLNLYDIIDAADAGASVINDIYGGKRMLVAVWGFGLISAGALLNICLSSLLASKGHSHKHAHNNEGGVVTQHDKVVGVHVV